MAGLLDGVTVLDLASVGPAVRATGWLADYGASVIKVAPLPRDGDLQLVPPSHLYSGGRGTRRVMIDLKSAAGREAFLKLAESVDVVVESFRPGVVDRLGVGYDAVKSANPRIVYCSTSGYGQTGRRSTWSGHDLNYLAVGGYLASQEPVAGGKPPRPGTSVADSAGGGLQATVAVLAGLVARNTTGEGCYLDVSVADGVLAMMSLQVDDVLATGAPQPPGSAPLGGCYAWYDVYATSDDRWVAVAAIERKFWANLCRALHLDRFAESQYDVATQPAIREAMTAAFASRTRDEWTELLAGADTCVSPVLTAEEVASDSGFASRGTVANARAVTGERWPQLAPLLAGAIREPDYDLPDRSRTDTDAVFAECGFSAEEITTLRDQGAIL